MNKKEGIILLVLIVVIPYVYGVESVVLDAFNDSDNVTGYSFTENQLADKESSDLYVILESDGEVKTYMFKAVHDNFLNKGKEGITEFRCDEDYSPESYQNEIQIFERQGYCVFTNNRKQMIKIYVTDMFEDANKVRISWTVHEPSALLSDILDEEEIIQQAASQDEEGIIAQLFGKREKEESEEDVPQDETANVEEDEEDEEEEEPGLLRRFFNSIYNTLKEHKKKVIALIVILIIYSVLSITLSEYSRRWRKKHKKRTSK